MTIVTIEDHGLGNCSYLVELDDKRALVVDPVRDPSPYVHAADEHGLRIAVVAETHLHADFVTGAPELAGLGARVLAPAGGSIERDHHGIEDDEEIDLGGVTLRAIATPGHTPEHLSYLLLDDSRPLVLFSGGALLPGAVARTDLVPGYPREAAARGLYRALIERILVLPDDLPVLPTHGGGSYCTASRTTGHATTIGAERSGSPLFAAGEEGFIARLLGSLGSHPVYFSLLREVNRHDVTVHGLRRPVLDDLEPDEVRRAVEALAVVVDARPMSDFATGHLPASISIPLRPAFTSWLGWVVPPDRPLVFVLDDDQDERELVEQCLKIGYEHLAGRLAGGYAAWVAAGLPVAGLDTVDAGEVQGTVLDVRQDDEYADGHIPGAVHVEAGDLRRPVWRVPHGPLTVMCARGDRAVTAASLLRRFGHAELTVAVGGPDDWSRATGRPLERSVA